MLTADILGNDCHQTFWIFCRTSADTSPDIHPMAFFIVRFVAKANEQ